MQEGWAFLRFVAHLDGADEDLAVDAVVDGDGVAPVEEVDVRAVAVLDLELLTADCSRLSSSLDAKSAMLNLKTPKNLFFSL